VLWKIKQLERMLVEAEYVLMREALLNGRLLNELRSHGFQPLVFTVEKAQEAPAGTVAEA